MFGMSKKYTASLACIRSGKSESERVTWQEFAHATVTAAFEATGQQCRAQGSQVLPGEGAWFSMVFGFAPPNFDGFHLLLTKPVLYDFEHSLQT